MIPAALREKDGIELGEEFIVQRLDRGDYRLTRSTVPPNAYDLANQLLRSITLGGTGSIVARKPGHSYQIPGR